MGVHKGNSIGRGFIGICWFAALLSAVIATAQTCHRTVTDAASAAALATAQLECPVLNITWAAHVMLDSTIDVGDGVVMYVKGPPSAVVDGGGKIQLFRVTAGGALHLSDLLLTGGFAEYRGGAVYVESGAVASFVSCNFTSNTGTSGGGVSNEGTVESIDKCTFTDNTADYGGGVYNGHGIVESMSDCSFTSNTANYNGGGVYNYDGTVASMSDCTFTNNTADHGGGVCNYIGTVTSMRDCTFTSNTAEDAGGALFINNLGTVERMSDCIFTSNTARFGGGVYSWGDVTNISDCTFTENTADYNGGGVENHGAMKSMSDCTFNSNTADYGGGGVSNFNGTLARMSDCTFTNNTAEYGGGVYSIYGTMESMRDCTFTKNAALFFGGGVYNAGGIVESMSACFFTDNTAGGVYSGSVYKGSGGGVYNFIGNMASMSECTFTNNMAALTGGGVYNNGTVTSMSECTFTNNTAAFVGGGVVNYGIVESTSACTFTYNTARFGGGIYSRGDVTRMSDCTFTENTADYGGGVFNDVGIVESISECTFTSNTARLYGGALFTALNSEVTGLRMSNFTGNAASVDGGAVLHQGNELHIMTCVFNANTANGGGGAISARLASTDIIVTGSAFNDNTAGGDGGAIDGPGNAFLNVTRGDILASIVTPLTNATDCTFTNNTASGNGGAVSGAHIGIAHSVFSFNNASNGGAIYTETQLSGGSSTFDTNYAINAGGAIFFSDVSDWAWPNGTFARNSAGCCYQPSSSTGSCSDVDGQAEALDQCCAPGEWVDTTTACTFCPGYWESAANTCAACTDGFDCSNVGLLVTTTPLKPGWWRGSPSYAEARLCLNADACGGDSISPDAYCTDGYTGALCAVCASGYTSGIAFECHKCGQGSAAASGCFLAVAVLVVIGIVWYIVSDLHDAPVSIKPSGTLGNIWAKVQAVPFGKLRAPIVVLQIVTQYVAITGTSYPPLYQNFLAVAGVMTVNLQLVVSLGCLVSFNFYEYLLLVTIAPIIIVVLLGASLAAAWRRTARAAEVGPQRSSSRDVAAPTEPSESRWEWAVGKHWLVFMVFTFLIYSTVSTAVFQTFACDDLRDVGAERYLQADYSIECYTTKHKGFMIYAAVMALVYPIGIPVLYAWMMWRQHSHIAVDRAVPESIRRADPSIQTTRFLWVPYKREVFWWEVAECVRRLCLTGVLVFILPGSIGQSAWASVFSMLSLAAVFYFLPHEDSVDAHIYGLGCIIIFCSMFFSVMIQAEAADNSGHAVSVLLVALNVFMIAATLVQCLYIAFGSPGALRDVSFYGIAEKGGECKADEDSDPGRAMPA